MIFYNLYFVFSLIDVTSDGEHSTEKPGKSS